MSLENIIDSGVGGVDVRGTNMLMVLEPKIGDLKENKSNKQINKMKQQLQKINSTEALYFVTNTLGLTFCVLLCILCVSYVFKCILIFR